MEVESLDTLLCLLYFGAVIIRVLASQIKTSDSIGERQVTQGQDAE